MRLNFVVQLDNYKEIKKFVESAERSNADVVWFQHLANWETVSEEEFRKRDVLNNNNKHFQRSMFYFK